MNTPVASDEVRLDNAGLTLGFAYEAGYGIGCESQARRESED